MSASEQPNVAQPQVDPAAFLRETQILMGTVTLAADEAAPRLGFEGKRGLERFRALCKAGKIPAFFDGHSYRAHWPTVTAALFGGPYK